MPTHVARRSLCLAEIRPDGEESKDWGYATRKSDAITEEGVNFSCFTPPRPTYRPEKSSTKRDPTGGTRLSQQTTAEDVSNVPITASYVTSPSLSHLLSPERISERDKKPVQKTGLATAKPRPDPSMTPAALTKRAQKIASIFALSQGPSTPETDDLLSTYTIPEPREDDLPETRRILKRLQETLAERRVNSTALEVTDTPVERKAGCCARLSRNSLSLLGLLLKQSIIFVFMLGLTAALLVLHTYLTEEQSVSRRVIA